MARKPKQPLPADQTIPPVETNPVVAPEVTAPETPKRGPKPKTSMRLPDGSRIDTF